MSISSLRDQQIGEFAAQRTGDVDPVRAGQSEVEQHGILPGGAGLGQPAGPGAAPGGPVAVAAQAGVEVASDGVVVLDDEDPGPVLG